MPSQTHFGLQRDGARRVLLNQRVRFWQGLAVGIGRRRIDERDTLHLQHRILLRIGCGARHPAATDARLLPADGRGRCDVPQLRRRARLPAPQHDARGAHTPAALADSASAAESGSGRLQSRGSAQEATLAPCLICRPGAPPPARTRRCLEMERAGTRSHTVRAVVVAFPPYARPCR